MFAAEKDLSVIRAETFFADFIVEHNLPISCADHAGPFMLFCHVYCLQQHCNFKASFSGHARAAWRSMLMPGF